jgi:hypothetical protein
VAPYERGTLGLVRSAYVQLAKVAAQPTLHPETRRLLHAALSALERELDAKATKPDFVECEPTEPSRDATDEFEEEQPTRSKQRPPLRMR